ncbi:unnamed protein product [Nippostrongylus brasiliensis]|uniref:Uncharacterized protein n=1 Tax=Nippostrongylus brasiliensis TaxID=27835 RepID=A0A0N4YPA1_NIPBR|nr:unnamed protein product [Nippostrongylus brasiliensis]
MDPLTTAAHSNDRPSSWIGFDEISMTSPVVDQSNSVTNYTTRPGSGVDDPFDGRNSVATEEKLELDDGERQATTPLPTKEVIAGVDKFTWLVSKRG